VIFLALYKTTLVKKGRAIDPLPLINQNLLLGGVPKGAGWVNLRHNTPSNLLRSIHSGLEGILSAEAYAHNPKSKIQNPKSHE
jgi:hypothetical protein